MRIPTTILVLTLLPLALADLSLRDCTLTENQVSLASVTISNSNNHAGDNFWDGQYEGCGGEGGGMVLSSSTGVLEDTAILDNQGALGGGLYTESSDLAMTRCNVSGNRVAESTYRTGYWDGAEGSETYYESSATYGGWGGGVNAFDTHLTLVNGLLAHNEATRARGAL